MRSAFRPHDRTGARFAPSRPLRGRPARARSFCSSGMAKTWMCGVSSSSCRTAWRMFAGPKVARAYSMLRRVQSARSSGVAAANQDGLALITISTARTASRRGFPSPTAAARSCQAAAASAWPSSKTTPGPSGGGVVCERPESAVRVLCCDATATLPIVRSFAKRRTARAGVCGASSIARPWPLPGPAEGGPRQGERGLFQPSGGPLGGK